MAPIRLGRIAHDLAIVVIPSLGIIVAGCDRQPDSTTEPLRRPGPSAMASLRVTGSKMRRPAEDMLVALAQEESSIAGYSLDAQGNLVVRVADTARAGSAGAVIMRHLSTDGLRLPMRYRSARVIAKPASYSFQQLSDWRDLVVDSLLGSDGVVMDNLDQAKNQVTVGINRNVAGAEGRVIARLAALAVPRQAVN